MRNARARATLTAGVFLVDFPSAPGQMKMPLARCSILVSLASMLLLTGLPGEIRRSVESGDPYLLTRQSFDDILARLSGPGRLRFILQPAPALLVGPVLSAVPYSLSRALTNRIARGRDQQATAGRPGRIPKSL